MLGKNLLNLTVILSNQVIITHQSSAALPEAIILLHLKSFLALIE
jgi:hypothetical protein